MKNVEQYIRLVDKYFNNYVFREGDVHYVYELKYFEDYDKFNLYVSIVVDVKRYLGSFPEYDMKYHNIINNAEDEIKSFLKYFGLSGHKDITIFINYEYINGDEIYAEARRLKEELKKIFPKIWVDVHESLEDYAGVRINIGLENTSFWLSISTDDAEWKIENIINVQGKYPHLKYLSDMDEIDFWWD